MLLLACALMAQGAPPPPAAKAFPFAYDLHDYPNGLRLVTIPTDYPHVVALYIVVQAGSRNEVEPGKSGFAHLFEHMMFRGTKQFPPARYEDTIKQAGAASNAYTSDDLTVYHTTFSKDDFDTIVMMEADRFQNLDYTEAAFRTETLAVLGEYNKNSAAPPAKLNEVLRNTAFDKHTYKHTTMGFLKDIEDMPNQYAYSRLFYQRFYRPEYTIIVVAGDITKERSRATVEKYWGNWKRGEYRPAIPAEPPAAGGPRANHVNWPTPTMPWLNVAYRAPAYTDTTIEGAALDLLAYIGFSESSDLYQKLVIKDQKVDAFGAGNPDHADPYLFNIQARLKKPADMDAVRQEILATVGLFRETKVAVEKLEAVKRHLRYQFALSLNSSEAIAAVTARYVSLRRTPETINRIYELYARVTPDDIRNVARKYLVDQGRTIVTLTSGGAQ
jgi:zinc protease